MALMKKESEVQEDPFTPQGPRGALQEYSLIK
jgi:hypothetical protein